MKVPIYEGMVRLPAEGPGAMGNLTAAALQGQAVAAAGNELLKITGEWNRSINQAQQLTDMATAHNDAREHLFNLKNDIRDNTDPDTWAPTFQGKAQEWFQERHDSLKDPAVQAQFKNWWGTQYYSVLQGITEKARTQKVLNFTGDIETNYGRSVDLYNQTEDDLEKARIKGDLHGMLDGGTTAGLLPPAKAQQLKQGFETAVMNDRLMKDAVNDPAGLLARTKDTQEAEKNYPGIDPKAVYTAHGHASAQVHKLQEANAVELEKAFQAGTLTSDSLKGQMEARQISLHHYKAYDALLTAQTAPGRAETNLDEYIPLFQAAQRGDMNPDRVYWAVKAGQLTKEDMHRLIGMQLQKEGRGEAPPDTSFTKNPWVKLGMDELHSALDPYDKNMAARMDKERAATGKYQPQPKVVNEAVDLFMRECQAADAKGELTPEFIGKKKTEIIQAFVQRETQRGGTMGRKGTAPPAQPRGGPAPAGSGPLFNPTKGPKQTQQEPW